MALSYVADGRFHGSARVKTAHFWAVKQVERLKFPELGKTSAELQKKHLTKGDGGIWFNENRVRLRLVAIRQDTNTLSTRGVEERVRYGVFGVLALISV